MDWYGLFPQILNMSLTASVVIVAVLLMRLCLKKAPKVFSYMLWAVVLFRLLCPVSISSAISAFNLLDTPVSQSGSIAYVPRDIVSMKYPKVELPVSGVSEVINESLPQGEEQLRADPLEAPISLMTYLWLCGIVVLLVYSALQLFLLWRRLVGAVCMQENIYLADHIDTPFVMGLIFPRIYLPSSLEKRERTYIILHEKHHIRRGDHITRILAFAALCIHWFNPLVWLAFMLSAKDMEMSCDEAVMKRLGSDIRAEYSASLLRLATGRRPSVGSPLAFGEGNPKGRIRNVMKYKRPKLWVLIAAFLICLTVLVCFVTNPREGQLKSSAAESGENLTNILMAEAPIDFGRYKGYSIKLIMTEGDYYNEKEVTPGGGTYAENYSGEYVLRLSDTSERIISELSLNHDWGYDSYSWALPINFPGEFPLCVSDYTGDGVPDFTLGTHGSSNGNLFMLYSLDSEGNIIPIVNDLFTVASKDFSVYLEQESGSSDFYTSVWNNATGEAERVRWKWNPKAEMYSVQEEAEEAMAEEMPEAVEDMKRVIPSAEAVEKARELALEGMTEEEIKRLKENIKVANQAMERAYLNDNIFEQLSDKDSLYWNYFDQKGEIQIGWTNKGTAALITYNRFDADNFMALMEDMKSSMQNDELKACMDQLIQYTEEAKNTHEVEPARNIYKLLHDMDYYLLRYGPDDVAKYVKDASLIYTYYGTLPFYD